MNSRASMYIYSILVNSSRGENAYYGTRFAEVFNRFMSRNWTFYSLDLFRCVFFEIRSFLTKCHLLSDDVDFRCVPKRYEPQANAFTRIPSLSKTNSNWLLLAGGNDFEREENSRSRKTEQDSVTLVVLVTSLKTKTAHYLDAHGTRLISWNSLMGRKELLILKGAYDTKYPVKQIDSFPGIHISMWCDKAFIAVHAHVRVTTE